jgi:homopolymeric O-antigen transport system permease protein
MDVYADLFRYRELFSNLFRRDLQAKYKGSVLGVAWSLLTPLALMAIYYIVFSKILGARFSGVHDYALFMLTGLACWTFVASALPNSSVSLLSNANLIRKVRFPRQLVPLSVVGTQVVAFSAMLVVVGVVNAIKLPGNRLWELLALPFAALLVCLVAGAALAVAAANVLFRDVEHLVNSLLLPLFFLTPVIYPLDERAPGLGSHPGWIKVLHWGNPLAPAINTIRATLFEATAPAWGDVIYTVVAAFLSLLLGAWVFRRLDDRIAVEL